MLLKPANFDMQADVSVNDVNEAGIIQCIDDCCLQSSSLGLLLGTKAPVMTPKHVDFSFFSEEHPMMKPQQKQQLRSILRKEIALLLHHRLHSRIRQL